MYNILITNSGGSTFAGQSVVVPFHSRQQAELVIEEINQGRNMNYQWARKLWSGTGEGDGIAKTPTGRGPGQPNDFIYNVVAA